LDIPSPRAEVERTDDDVQSVSSVSSVSPSKPIDQQQQASPRLSQSPVQEIPEHVKENEHAESEDEKFLATPPGVLLNESESEGEEVEADFGTANDEYDSFEDEDECDNSDEPTKVLDGSKQKTLLLNLKQYQQETSLPLPVPSVEQVQANPTSGSYPPSTTLGPDRPKVPKSAGRKNRGGQKSREPKPKEKSGPKRVKAHAKTKSKPDQPARKLAESAQDVHDLQKNNLHRKANTATTKNTSKKGTAQPQPGSKSNRSKKSKGLHLTSTAQKTDH